MSDYLFNFFILQENNLKILIIKNLSKILDSKNIIKKKSIARYLSK